MTDVEIAWWSNSVGGVPGRPGLAPTADRRRRRRCRGFSSTAQQDQSAMDSCPVCSALDTAALTINDQLAITGDVLRFLTHTAAAAAAVAAATMQ